MQFRSPILCCGDGAFAPSSIDSQRNQPAPIAAPQFEEYPLVVRPQTQLRANWSKIEPGLGANQVSRLLGEPTKKLRLDGRIAWYYSYPALGNGSVFFTDAGRVSTRQSPWLGRIACPEAAGRLRALMGGLRPRRCIRKVSIWGCRMTTRSIAAFDRLRQSGSGVPMAALRSGGQLPDYRQTVARQVVTC